MKLKVVFRAVTIKRDVTSPINLMAASSLTMCIVFLVWILLISLICAHLLTSLFFWCCSFKQFVIFHLFNLMDSFSSSIFVCFYSFAAFATIVPSMQRASFCLYYEQLRGHIQNDFVIGFDWTKLLLFISFLTLVQDHTELTKRQLSFDG